MSKNRIKKLKDTRPSWDEYFLSLMIEVGKRATCNRGRSGAIIVKNKRLLATGYVGSPPGMAHCDEIGHQMRKYIDNQGKIKEGCIRTIHAEQNAICQAAKFGISIEGATIYVFMEPCAVCAKMIASCGIKRVVALYKYQAAQETREIFRQSKVKLDVIKKELPEYMNRKEK
jgi:dCMP deaminase